MSGIEICFIYIVGVFYILMVFAVAMSAFFSAVIYGKRVTVFFPNSQEFCGIVSIIEAVLGFIQVVEFIIQVSISFSMQMFIENEMRKICNHFIILFLFGIHVCCIYTFALCTKSEENIDLYSVILIITVIMFGVRTAASFPLFLYTNI